MLWLMRLFKAFDRPLMQKPAGYECQMAVESIGSDYAVLLEYFLNLVKRVGHLLGSVCGH